MQIFSEKKKYDNVQSKCGSKANADHKPAGGDKKVREGATRYVNEGWGYVIDHKPSGRDRNIRKGAVNVG